MAITHKIIEISIHYIYVFRGRIFPATFNLSKLFSKFSFKKLICYFVEKI